MRYLLRRHIFLLVGVATCCLFFLVAALDDRAGHAGIVHVLAVPLRVLIVPEYLVWLVLTMAQVAVAGPHGLPGLLGVIVSAISFWAGLAPYILADWIVARRRRARAR